MLVFLLVLLAGSALLKGQETLEAIVAIVNDDIITLSDYKAQHDMFHEQLRQQFQGEDFDKQYEIFREQLLEVMITNALLLHEAESREEIDVTEQLNTYIQNMMAENGIESEAQLKAAMLQQGVVFENWKRSTEESFLRDAVIYLEVGRSIVVDDAEIFNYYRQHPEEYTVPMEFTVKGIYISSELNGAEEAQNKMAEISKKLDAGEDFGALAGAYSEGPEKESQGDLGSFKEGEWAPELEKEVAKLEAGANTSWITVTNGWFLLHLVEKKESFLQEFDDVRANIQQKIIAERQGVEVQKYIEKLKERSYIKILIEKPYLRINR
jgi:parvulin-like peptidyl-prolyl isomerase